ncbi:ABC transporter ATP-binding protein [Sphingosinicella sp. YJ22]|uniref:ATP-binding cassette domain-containing protein n=1 Tax=Sphingosinicella sp. YJ22 TaxID=1104780 RepID=UPI00140829AD|nr:ABC transporter ATP-binding protein [Sphingosinicella sp. YJ22]
MIELADVTKRHGAGTALDGVSLTAAAGEFVALVGPSGSGKTTLLKSINRLAAPDEGIVRVDGRDVRDMPVTELRRGIGYVIQGIGLFPHMTVAENIWIVPRLAGTPATEREGRVAELLDLVALPREFAGRMPSSLSGGQAQRVGVARALAAGPRIMLMDEPFGALDPVTRDELGRSYRALHDSLALTSIMVTHDMAEALLIADRIVVLIDGRVRADLPPAELLSSQDPEVRALVDVPRRQAERLHALAEGR